MLFDEFHERNLHADVGLALALDAQRHVAPELRVLAMSATLDGASVAELARRRARDRGFGPHVPGRDALPRQGLAGAARRRRSRSTRASRAPCSARSPNRPATCCCSCPVRARSGACSARLREERALGADVDVLPLYGELAPGEQDAALAPARAGRRKVVLATNIAETSLTIDGVRVVVDAGLERRNVFDPGSGMSRLETQRISRASAEQRAGRAGRTAPGVCYRLWGESAERTLAAYAPAEIAERGSRAARVRSRCLGAPTQRAALARRAAGRDARRRARPAAAPRRARRGRPRHGARPRDAASSPRIRGSRTCCSTARELGAAAAAAELAALLSERDLLRGAGEAVAPTATCARAWTYCAASGGGGVDRGVLERVRRAERAYLRELGAGDERARRDSPYRPAVLLAFAYPDRIAKRRPGGDGRYQLANGRGASFASPEPIAREELIVAVDLDDRERDARILLAAPLSRADLLEHFAAELVTRDEVAWDARAEAVVARRTVRFGELVLEEKPLADSPPGAAAAALARRLALARARGVAVGRRRAATFAARSEFVRDARPRRSRRLAGLSPPRRSRATSLARAVSRRRHAARALRARAARAALRARLTAGAIARARRARADAHHAADRHARADRLSSTTTRRARRCACRRCSGSRRRRASAAARCPSRSSCCRPRTGRCR